MNTPYGDISSKEAAKLGDIIDKLLHGTPIMNELIADDVQKAWDKITGFPPPMVKRYYRDGVLHVSFNSSALRSTLYPRRNEITRRLNAYLQGFPRFKEIDTPVRNIIFS